MKCVRCGGDKTEDQMAKKSKGKLRRWCWDCENARRRLKLRTERAQMHSNVLVVSNMLGRVLAEAPL